MPSPTIEALLIFQDRDQRRVALETQLRAVPTEVALLERKIAETRAAAEAAKAEWRELETRRKTLETEVGAAEDRVARFKSQQLQVRKNDEYQALGNEIEHAQGEIARLEDEEIGVMLLIDQAKAKSVAADAAAREQIAGHEALIAQVREREKNLRAELDAARAAVDSARAAVAPSAVPLYERLAKSAGLPVVVPLREHKCGGCHLKVSSGVESDVRAGHKLTTCDNCGRILYWEG